MGLRTAWAARCRPEIRDRVCPPRPAQVKRMRAMKRWLPRAGVPRRWAGSPDHFVGGLDRVSSGSIDLLTSRPVVPPGDRSQLLMIRTPRVTLAFAALLAASGAAPSPQRGPRRP